MADPPRVRETGKFSPKLRLALLHETTALSAWRLKLIAQDLGYRLSIRNSIAALSLGLLAGTMFFQLIGQLMARGALLARRGMPVAATITLTVYERAAAAGVSLLLAIAGGWYVLGRVTLDIEHGGLVFLKIVAGLTLAMAAGGWLAWGSKALAAAPRKIDRAFLVPIARNVLISTAIQCTTMAAYVAAAHALAPAVPLLDLAAATAVVMLAAALPISLGGWGVRELSAVAALGAVGVPIDAALIVAILIGVTSLLVVGAFALSSLWPGTTADADIGQPGRSADRLRSRTGLGNPDPRCHRGILSTLCSSRQRRVERQSRRSLAISGRCAVFDIGNFFAPLAGMAAFLVQRPYFRDHRCFRFGPAARGIHIRLDLMGADKSLRWVVHSARLCRHGRGDRPS